MKNLTISLLTALSLAGAGAAIAESDTCQLAGALEVEQCQAQRSLAWVEAQRGKRGDDYQNLSAKLGKRSLYKNLAATFYRKACNAETRGDQSAVLQNKKSGDRYVQLAGRFAPNSPKEGELLQDGGEENAFAGACR